MSCVFRVKLITTVHVTVDALQKCSLELVGGALESVYIREARGVRADGSLGGQRCDGG